MAELKYFFTAYDESSNHHKYKISKKSSLKYSRDMKSFMDLFFIIKILAIQTLQFIANDRPLKRRFNCEINIKKISKLIQIRKWK